MRTFTKNFKHNDWYININQTPFQLSFVPKVDKWAHKHIAATTANICITYLIRTLNGQSAQHQHYKIN